MCVRGTMTANSLLSAGVIRMSPGIAASSYGVANQFMRGVISRVVASCNVATPAGSANNFSLAGCRSLARALSSATGGEVIGIDLGTTNSCVAVMEGKVS